MRIWIALVLAGCGLFARPVIRPKPLAVQPAPVQAPLQRCEVGARPDLADPRWAPVVTGALELAGVRGDPRLTVLEGGWTVWSPDSTELLVPERAGLLVWKVADGSLATAVRYPRGELEVRGAAWSPDGRWLLVTGSREVAGGTPAGATILFDRQTSAVRELDRSFAVPLDDELRFSADGRTVRGRGLELDLASGLIREVPDGIVGNGVLVRRKSLNQTSAIELVDPSTGAILRTLPFAWSLTSVRVLDGGARLAVGTKGELQLLALPSGDLIRRVPLPGAEVVAVSPDGKRVAGWTIMRVELLGGGDRDRAARPPHQPFLAMWDVETGRRLWRDPTRCCSRYVFSRNGELLQHGLGSAHEEVVRVATGEPIAFPAMLGRISPDGRRIFAYDRGLAVWSIRLPPEARAQTRREAAPAAAGTVLARSGSGAFVEATAVGTLLASGETCTPLHAIGRDGDHFEFDEAGVTVFGVRRFRNTVVSQWRTGDGRPLAAMRANAHQEVVLMPELGRAAFLVDGGVRVFDVKTADELAVVDAPRVSYTSPVNGQVWDQRDLDGDRAGRIGGATITADGRYLAGWTAFRGYVVTIWDLVEPRRVVDLPVNGIVSVTAIERGNRFVAGGTRKGALYLWARPGHAPVTLGTSHRGWVRALEFSPDGTRLATAADDGVVHVFDTATGAVVGSVELAMDRPSRLSWSRDGAVLTIDTARRLVVRVTL